MLNIIARAFLLTILLASTSTFAVTEDFSDAEALGRWITYYYTKPEPQGVAEAIQAASSHGFMRNGKKAAPFFGFIAGVINKSPSTAQALVEQLASLPEDDRPVVILGIWYSNHPNAKPLLEGLSKSMPVYKENIDSLLANQRPGILDLPIEQGPWVLDALWGYFMATGDEAPITRIISALPWFNAHDDVHHLLIGGAARWSLISNAIQHERVMAICRKEVASQPKEVKEVLQEVIASAEKDMKAGKTR